MKTNPYYYQRVNDPAELRRFAQNYLAESGNTLSEEFLANAIVYQFYIGPFPVAGVVYNTIEMNQYLRTISYLDEPVVHGIMNYEDLSPSDVLEISANYRVKTLGLKRTMILYAIMLDKAREHAQRLNKTYIMAGSVVKALQLVHQLLLTRTIYFGPISVDRQASVKGKFPLLKIYVSKVRGFRFRAMLALVNLFLARTKKKSGGLLPPKALPVAVVQPPAKELVSEL